MHEVLQFLWIPAYLLAGFVIGLVWARYALMREKRPLNRNDADGLVVLCVIFWPVMVPWGFLDGMTRRVLDRADPEVARERREELEADIKRRERELGIGRG